MTSVPPGNIWQGVPEARRVNVSEMTDEQLDAFLATHIDESRAAEIVAKIDGSASDYVTNMQRVKTIMNGLTFGLGMAMKIIIVV